MSAQTEVRYTEPHENQKFTSTEFEKDGCKVKEVISKADTKLLINKNSVYLPGLISYEYKIIVTSGNCYCNDKETVRPVLRLLSVPQYSALRY